MGQVPPRPALMSRHYAASTTTRVVSDQLSRHKGRDPARGGVGGGACVACRQHLGHCRCASSSSSSTAAAAARFCSPAALLSVGWGAKANGPRPVSGGGWRRVGRVVGMVVVREVGVSGGGLCGNSVE